MRVLLALGLALVSATAGCAGSQVEDRAGPWAGTDAPLQDAGPWKEDFREALNAGVSGYEAKVLGDGKVTTAELEDAHERIRGCLADSGYTITYGTDGGFELGSSGGSPPSDDMNRTNSVLEACEKRYDQSITFLYQETRRNPDKEDEAKITVACLRKAGLVAKGYSERKWRAENDKGVYSFKEYDPDAVQCRLDPLGLWRDG